MTLYTQQSSNIRKTWFLMIGFLVFFIAVGYFLSEYYQNASILYGFLIFSIFSNIVSYWYSDKIVLKMSHARKVTREEYMDLWNVTENLCITAGLPMPKLYIIDDISPNAFATGRNKENGVVAVTTGLLTVLDRTELEGVIAHELAHIGNRDILLMSMVSVLVGSITLIADFVLRGSFFGNRERGNSNQILMILGIVFIIISPIIAKIIQLAISRKREFLADATAGLLTRYPEGLANALKKISMHSKPMSNSHVATAHMFISNPFSNEGRVKSYFGKLFMTHPPVEERINALLNQKN